MKNPKEIFKLAGELANNNEVREAVKKMVKNGFDKAVEGAGKIVDWLKHRGEDIPVVRSAAGDTAGQKSTGKKKPAVRKAPAKKSPTAASKTKAKTKVAPKVEADVKTKAVSKAKAPAKLPVKASMKASMKAPVKAPVTAARKKVSRPKA